MAGVGFVLADWLSLLLTCCFYASVPWHFLYFLPEPHGQGSLRPTFSPVRRWLGWLAAEPPAMLAAANSRCFLRANSFSSASMVVECWRVGTGISRGAPSRRGACAPL